MTLVNLFYLSKSLKSLWSSNEILHILRQALVHDKHLVKAVLVMEVKVSKHEP